MSLNNEDIINIINLEYKKYQGNSTIIQKINERLAAKKKGDYKLADRIRNDLLDKGVIIEDQKEKTIWKFK